MKGMKRIWIIGLMLLALGVFIAQAFTIPGFELISGISGNIGNVTFRYVFIAVGIVTFYYLNKNLSSMNKGVTVALSLIAAYAISAWRMSTDGWEAYLYVILICMTLKARKGGSHWGPDVVGGIDTGIMYMVAAGVLAPFNSLAAGVKTMEEALRAFLTHFLIGVGFPVLIIPMKKMLFGKKDLEGEGLFGMWRKHREEKKKKQEEDKLNIDLKEKEIKHEEKETDIVYKRLEEVEKRLEESARNPYDQKQSQQLVQSAQPIAPMAYMLPIHMPTVNPETEAKKVNAEMSLIREAIARLESETPKTPEGKAAEFVHIHSEYLKKHREHIVEMFGPNMNDKMRFLNALIKFSGDYGSHATYTDVNKRLDEFSKKTGIVNPEIFLQFADKLKKDYSKEREHCIKILKEALHKEATAGAEDVQEARYVDNIINDVNKRAAEDERITEVVNKEITDLKTLLQRADLAGGRKLTSKQLAELMEYTGALNKKIRGEVELKKKNEKLILKEVKAVKSGFKMYLVKSDKGYFVLNVPIFEALDAAYGEQTEEMMKRAEEESIGVAGGGNK